MSFSELSARAITKLPSSAFLVCNSDGNPMTIGWAQFGVIWGKQICTVFVRKSRYSHELIEKSGAFTVSIPKDGSFVKELAYCGKISGRDEDKLNSTGLKLTLPKVNGIPGIAGCAMHFECKVVHKAEFDLSFMDDAIRSKNYGDNQATPDGDPHTVYFGEVLASYEE